MWASHNDRFLLYTKEPVVFHDGGEFLLRELEVVMVGYFSFQNWLAAEDLCCNAKFLWFWILGQPYAAGRSAAALNLLK